MAEEAEEFAEAVVEEAGDALQEMLEEATEGVHEVAADVASTARELESFGAELAEAMPRFDQLTKAAGTFSALAEPRAVKATGERAPGAWPKVRECLATALAKMLRARAEGKFVPCVVR